MRRFLHAPFWLAVALVLVTGCVSPAERVLASVNAYHYWIGEYEKTCGGAARPECKTWHAALVEHKARFVAAEEAMGRGGKFPLQMKAMKAAEKAAARPR